MTDQPNEADAVAREIVEKLYPSRGTAFKATRVAQVRLILTRLLSQRDQRIAELEREKDELSYRSVCAFCGHGERVEDAEVRLNRMVEHIVVCEKHPLHQVPALIAAKEAAEAQVAALQAEREGLTMLSETSETLIEVLHKERRQARDDRDAAKAALAEAKGLLRKAQEWAAGYPLQGSGSHADHGAANDVYQSIRAFLDPEAKPSETWPNAAGPRRPRLGEMCPTFRPADASYCVLTFDHKGACDFGSNDFAKPCQVVGSVCKTHHRVVAACARERVRLEGAELMDAPEAKPSAPEGEKPWPTLRKQQERAWSKEWCLERARLETGYTIAAGAPPHICDNKCSPVPEVMAPQPEGGEAKRVPEQEKPYPCTCGECVGNRPDEATVTASDSTYQVIMADSSLTPEEKMVALFDEYEREITAKYGEAECARRFNAALAVATDALAKQESESSASYPECGSAQMCAVHDWPTGHGPCKCGPCRVCVPPAPASEQTGPSERPHAFVATSMASDRVWTGACGFNVRGNSQRGYLPCGKPASDPCHTPAPEPTSGGRAMSILARGMGRCRSDEDGDCDWRACPQKRDGEPERTGRHCPYDAEARKDEDEEASK